MSDLTLGDALRARERSKERARRMVEDVKEHAESNERRRQKRRAARREERERQEFWCSLGRHRAKRQLHLAEEFRGGTACMECQLKIVENLETVLEVPAVTAAMTRLARRRKVEKQQKAVMDSMRRMKYREADGLIYYMRINGRIKIGYTTNLLQRSRHYPPGTELLAVEPGTQETEARRHNQFSRSLAQGREWFAESDAIRAHVAELAATYGVPSKLMYRHSKHEGIKHV